MNWIRSKKFNKHLQAVQDWTMDSFIDIDFKFQKESSIYVADSIWEDISIQDWINTYFSGIGEKELVKTILQTPITNINRLKERQYALYFFTNKKNLILTPEYESTIRWFLKKPTFDKNYLYNYIIHIVITIKLVK